MNREREIIQRALLKRLTRQPIVRVYCLPPVGVSPDEAWQNPALRVDPDDGPLFWVYGNALCHTHRRSDGDAWFYESLELAAQDHRVAVQDLMLHWGETVGHLLSGSGLHPNDFNTDGIEDEMYAAMEVLERCPDRNGRGVRALERLIRLQCRKGSRWQRREVRELAEGLAAMEPLDQLIPKGDALWEASGRGSEAA